MPAKITDLEPKRLFYYFHQMNQIPRCSKNEKDVREYLLSVAREKGLEANTDSAGNVVIRVPATSGKEGAPTVVLQGHTDMVCEKNKAIKHDFSRDPIRMNISGDWIEAEGTTLGADNGIGVAAALAVLDQEDAVHGPLELLFTVDEETGLTGAQSLGKDFLTGKILLNLDSEEEGELYIGCAGGKDTIGKFSVAYQDANAAAIPVRVSVTGLKGGHSGIDIHLGRANAVKLLAQTLQQIYAGSPFHIAAIEGGSKRNAIPREAEAVIFIPPESVDLVRSVTESVSKSFRSDYASTDPGLKILVEEVGESFDKFFTLESTSTLISLLEEIPHGVIAMSADVPGLVETSTNLASVAMHDGTVVIATSQRSSIDAERDAIAERVAHYMASADAKVKHSDGYPGWRPNLSSNILMIAKSIFTQYYEKEPEVKAIHAGLECGIIGEKFPDMDMISFGPTITGPHTPDECVHIPSVKNFYTCLLLILKKLAG
jgi:dipeptidase D